MKNLMTAIIIISILAIAGIAYLTQTATVPKDTKIVQTLDRNKQRLLSIDGVVGAGIARDRNNYIIGIAVFIEDDTVNIQEIPNQLDGFAVFTRRLNETDAFERERMIIHRCPEVTIAPQGTLTTCQLLKNPQKIPWSNPEGFWKGE